eukprot:2579342-Pyramimonas_sp.AAC.1
MARSDLSLGKTPPRWTPQQPSKVATSSQIAAPQGWRDVPPLDPPAALESSDSYADCSPPGMA